MAAHLALRDDEIPLVIRLDNAETLMCWARWLRHSIPVGTGYRTGTVTGGAVQFEATDPRRYSLTEQRIETRLPSLASTGTPPPAPNTSTGRCTSALPARPGA
ncbi:hypothetical protein GCM10010211_28790 [Streptomyces albospinus]|uniref:Uncharacterized protein n=1 Tax=Streptomyces albospinus TaxID=285515 RepID=A0ABQ2UZQ0_9ACTN|nr:hypothetical protein [Streptomyces albospinus]GGU62006.1 hypothetical protein GCM10010211_28790 [Streptomyces albospinus]